VRTCTSSARERTRICYLSTDGRRLIVAPAEQSERRQKFEAAQRTAHKRYGKAFKKLAE